MGAGERAFHVSICYEVINWDDIGMEKGVVDRSQLHHKFGEWEREEERGHGVFQTNTRVCGAELVQFVQLIQIHKY